MAFQTQCPQCESSFQVPLDWAGQKGKCNRCGHKFLIENPIRSSDSADSWMEELGLTGPGASNTMMAAPGRSLIDCPECGRKISRSAHSCPQCGYVLRRNEPQFGTWESPTSRPREPSSSQAICAVASFFFPGLGQIIQGRILAAVLFFFLTPVVWLVTLFMGGWLMHVIAAWDAASYTPERK